MKKILLVAIISLPLALSAQTGPGGVGNTSNNRLWLRADAGVQSDHVSATPAVDGNGVQKWLDQSGNGNHQEQTRGSLNEPSYKTDFVNGWPAIEFDGSRNYLSGSIDEEFGADATVVAVGRFEHLNQSIGNYDYLLCLGGGFVGSAGNFSISRTASSHSSGGDLFYTYNGAGTHIGPTIPGQQWTLFTAQFQTSTPYFQLRMDGAGASISDYPAPFFSNGVFDLGWYTSGGGNYFSGQVAEVIAYSTNLNMAERAILENYLAAKYDLTLPSDLYAFDGAGQYGYEVFGLGQATDGTSNATARGSGILEVGAASNLGNGEYMLFGHNGLETSYSFTDVPSSLNIGGQRLSRVWRVDETGNVGTVTLTFHLAGSGLTNPGALELLVDADGSFAAGATRIAGSWSSEFETLTFSGVDLSDGLFLTLGFSSTTVAESDQTGPAGIGNFNNNKLWLDAQTGVYQDAGTTLANSNDDPVGQWNDRSGNDFHLTQTTNSKKPSIDGLLQADQLAIDFDGFGRYLSGEIVGGLSDELTVFAMNRFRVDNQEAEDWDYVWCLGEGGAGPLTSASFSRNDEEYESQPDAFFSYGGDQEYFGPFLPGESWMLVTTRNFREPPYNDLWFDGASQTVDHYSGPISTNGVFEIGRMTAEDDHYLDGTVAEVIVYNEKLSTAQRILVENYLAAKYDLSGLTNDYYSYDDRTSNGQHFHEVFGIGRSSFLDRQEVARGSGMLTLAAQDELAIGDYIIVGHNDGPTVIDVNDAPTLGRASGDRMNRTWRVGESGTPGKLLLSFDLSGLSITNPGSVELAVDGDGTFASGAKSYQGSWDAVNQVLSFSGVDLADGDYFTLWAPGFYVTYTTTPATSTSKASVEVTAGGGYPPYLLLWDDATFPTQAEFDTDKGGLGLSLSYSEFIQAYSDAERSGWESGIFNLMVVDSLNDTIDTFLFADHAIEWAAANGMEINGNTLTKNGPDGWNTGQITAINTFHSGRNDAVEFQLDQNDGQYVLGFRKPADAQAAQYTDTDYSLFLSNDTIIVWGDSILDTTSLLFAPGDVFSARFENQTLIFAHQGADFKSYSLPTDQEYAVDFSVYRSGGAVGQIRLTPKPFPTYSVVTTHASCVPPYTGSVDVTIDGSGEVYGNLAYEWADEFGDVIATTQDLTGVGPGTYTLLLSYTNIANQTTSVSIVVTVLNRVDWTNFSATAPMGGDPSSLEKTGANQTFDGLAESVNRLNANEDGWFSFRVDIPGTKYQAVCGLSEASVTGTQPHDIEHAFHLYSIGGAYFYTVLDNNSSLWPQGQNLNVSSWTPATDVFKVERQNNNFHYFVGNQLVQTTSSGNWSDAMMVDANIFSPNAQINHALASFGCEARKPLAELKKKLDGSYYPATDQVVRFRHFEQYNDSDQLLDYQVYDDFHQPLNLPGIAVDAVYGDNRNALDLRAANLPGGYYILEVSNEKGEQWYLRFKI